METDAENRKIFLTLRIPILSFPAFPTLASFLPLFLLPGTPASLSSASFTAMIKHADTKTRWFFVCFFSPLGN